MDEEDENGLSAADYCDDDDHIEHGDELLEAMERGYKCWLEWKVCSLFFSVAHDLLQMSTFAHLSLICRKQNLLLSKPMRSLFSALNLRRKSWM